MSGLHMHDIWTIFVHAMHAAFYICVCVYFATSTTAIQGYFVDKWKAYMSRWHATRKKGFFQKGTQTSHIHLKVDKGILYSIHYNK